MENLGAMLTAEKKIEFMPLPMPQVGDDDVLVEIKHVGLCGSDVSVFKDPTLGGMFPDLPLPILLGHECAGKVIALGKNVTTLSLGDLVALEPGVPCGHCDFCMSGRYNLCNDVLFMAAPPWKTGALCKYVSHPASRTFRLPDNMDTIEGALMEPLAVGMHAALQAQANPCKNAVIVGGGCIGLMTALSCKACGISNLAVADLFEPHLEVAKGLGIPHLINSSKEDLRQQVMELTQGQGADLVFETAGSPITAAATTKLVKRGGDIVLVGNIHAPVDFNFWEISFNENRILTIFRYKNLYPSAITAVSNGLINVKPLATHVFKFQNTQEAFMEALMDKEHSIRVIVEL